VSAVTNEAISKTRTYLENVVDSTVGSPDVDLYELAIMGYALSLAGSTKVSTVLEELDKKAIKKG